jgi:hypothetical protein
MLKLLYSKNADNLVEFYKVACRKVQGRHLNRDHIVRVVDTQCWIGYEF